MLNKWNRKICLFVAAVILTTLLPTTIPYSVGAAAANKTVKKAPTITSIANINKTVDIDTYISMPTTVVATMSDKKTKSVAIKWDKVLNADADGTYIANGTVAGYAKKVVFKLVVKPPKMGTIDIPKVTDATLKMPTDIKLGLPKKSIDEGNNSKEVDYTLPSIFWTSNSKEADEYAIRIYDQYKRLIQDTGTSLSESEIQYQGYYFKLNLDKVKDVTISAITITPVNSGGDGRQSGSSTNDKVGETAVFNCCIKITHQVGKQTIMTAKPNENNKDMLNISISEKIAPYLYFGLKSDYRFPKSSAEGVSEIGGFSAKDGSILIDYVNTWQYNNYYTNLSAKLSLNVYSNAVIESSNKAAFTITTYPVDYKDNPRAIAAKAFEGVYKCGNKTLVVTTKGQDIKYFYGDIHVVENLGSSAYICRGSLFDGDKKITDVIENGDGLFTTTELVLDGDTIHYKKIYHQENNRVYKLDFKRTKDDVLKEYDKYYKQERD